MFASIVHDRMTECVYDEPLATFATDASPEETYTVPVLAEGRAALERVDKEMGLAFDEEDFDYYLTLFRDDIGRDPTNVELFDMGQSNSEHSRHWFFGGNLIVDGVPQPASLFKMVKDTIAGERGHNSVIAFKDNSSAIRGFVNTPLRPLEPGGPSALAPRPVDLDLLLTAETHNFPPRASRPTRARRRAPAAGCATRTPPASGLCSPRARRGTASGTCTWTVTPWRSRRRRT